MGPYNECVINIIYSLLLQFALNIEIKLNLRILDSFFWLILLVPTYILIQRFIIMGNSKTKPGIFINTNKPFYLPGELIEGNIFINAPKAYPASRILLNIRGYEKISWKRQQNQSKKDQQKSDGAEQSMVVIKKNTIPSENKYKTKKFGEDKMGDLKIIQISYALSVWTDDHSLHGQYAFPFVFHLPSFLPASFKEETPQYMASIIYEISCVCVSPKTEFANLTEKKEILIRSAQKKQNQEMYGQIYINPKSCCCFGQGVSKISCYFQKNQYLPSEQCVALCEIDNFKSKTKIKCIKAKLKKIISLISDSGQEITFCQELNETEMQGVQPHQQCLGDNSLKMTIPLKYKKSDQAIPPTTNGGLIKCYYQLEISPVIAGCCTKSNLYFTVRLDVAQEAAKLEVPEAPPGWNPQVFNRSDIFMEESNSSNHKLSSVQNPYY